jgi:pimeloyl-ACP methyl ester carboxylesterase
MTGISLSALRMLVLFAVCAATAVVDAASEERGADLRPTAINESMYVHIGGIDQWLQIRGDDPANPVLLWLNGGPGLSTIPSTYLYAPWEHAFTVVMWDQRGEGKTFERSGESVAASMTIEQMASDGIEVAEFLESHLHKKNIILLGHSWGSILGIHMIMRRPDLFAAYVGTGQVINIHRQFEAGYPRLLKHASTNLEADRELRNIGPPPWKDAEAYKIVNKWADRLDPPEKENAPVPPATVEQWRSRYFQGGAEFSGRVLFDAIGREDMSSFATRFAVPVIFIQGSDDLLTTTSVVKSYFNQIAAPKKKFIELPGDGHLAIFRDPDAFLAQLVKNVRPLAMENSRSH